MAPMFTCHCASAMLPPLPILYARMCRLVYDYSSRVVKVTLLSVCQCPKWLKRLKTLGKGCDRCGAHHAQAPDAFFPPPPRAEGGALASPTLTVTITIVSGGEYDNPGPLNPPYTPTPLHSPSSSSPLIVMIVVSVWDRRHPSSPHNPATDCPVSAAAR